MRAVHKGESVTITGFGVFEQRRRAARVARNPRTGETVKVKPTSVPAFRPGAQFKAVVSGAQRLPADGPAVKRGVTAAPAKRTAAKKAAPAKKAAVKKAAPAKKAPARQEGRTGQEGSGCQEGRTGQEGSGREGAAPPRRPHGQEGSGRQEGRTGQEGSGQEGSGRQEGRTGQEGSGRQEGRTGQARSQVVRG